MIGYVTLGTNNLEKASEFYDALFATIDGTPGLRVGNFYAGYFRDLDGNKLNAFCIVKE